MIDQNFLHGINDLQNLVSLENFGLRQRNGGMTKSLCHAMARVIRMITNRLRNPK